MRSASSGVSMKTYLSCSMQGPTCTGGSTLTGAQSLCTCCKHFCPGCMKSVALHVLIISKHGSCHPLKLCYMACPVGYLLMPQALHVRKFSIPIYSLPHSKPKIAYTSYSSCWLCWTKACVPQVKQNCILSIPVVSAGKPKL